jgi:hypothetical protein
MTNAEWWNGGMVEWWSGGVVEWWSEGGVKGTSRSVEVESSSIPSLCEVKSCRLA